LNIDINSIPSHNPTIHLPFCPDCLLKMSELLQLNLQLACLQSNFSELKATLVATVLESVHVHALNAGYKIPNSIVRHIHRKIRDRRSPSTNIRNVPNEPDSQNGPESIPNIQERSPKSYTISTATISERSRNSSQLVEVTASEINDGKSLHDLDNENDYDPLSNVEAKLKENPIRFGTLTLTSLKIPVTAIRIRRSIAKLKKWRILHSRLSHQMKILIIVGHYPI